MKNETVEAKLAWVTIMHQIVLHNSMKHHITYHTCCHSIGTYDMVQEYVSSRASFIMLTFLK